MEDRTLIYILLGVIVAMFVYFQMKTNNVEKMADETNQSIVDAVNTQYKIDVEAIRNLGDFARTLLSEDRTTLTMPFDKVIINGELQVGEADEEGNRSVRIFGEEGGGRVSLKSKVNGSFATLEGPEDGGARTGLVTKNPLWVYDSITAGNGRVELKPSDVGKKIGGQIRLRNDGNSNYGVIRGDGGNGNWVVVDTKLEVKNQLQTQNPLVEMKTIDIKLTEKGFDGYWGETQTGYNGDWIVGVLDDVSQHSHKGEDRGWGTMVYLRGDQWTLRKLVRHKNPHKDYQVKVIAIRKDISQHKGDIRRFSLMTP